MLLLQGFASRIVFISANLILYQQITITGPWGILVHSLSSCLGSKTLPFCIIFLTSHDQRHNSTPPHFRPMQMFYQFVYRRKSNFSTYTRTRCTIKHRPNACVLSVGVPEVDGARTTLPFGARSAQQTGAR